MKRFAILTFFVLFSSATYAQESANDPVLIENGITKIYLSEYQAELRRLPEGMRQGFGNSIKRIEQLLIRMLSEKTFAEKAKKEGLDKTSDGQAFISVAEQRALSSLYLMDVEKKAAQRFDEKKDDFLKQAKEKYLLNKKKYEIPAQVEASHILISTEKHSSEEAEVLAKQVYERVKKGEEFNEVAKEVSEDQSVAENSGHLNWFAESQMAPEFSKAAFGLSEVGDISEPVKTQFGWHVILLEGKNSASQKSFEEVQGSIMNELREEYLSEEKTKVQKEVAQMKMTANGDAIEEHIFIYVDPEKVKKITQDAAE